jgi:hypothetical protein
MMILFVCRKQIKKNLSQNWLGALNGSKKFTWFVAPLKGRSGGLLVGINTATFDVIDHTVEEFMIVFLIHHKNLNLTRTLSNVYGPAQADNRDKFLS